MSFGVICEGKQSAPTTSLGMDVYPTALAILISTQLRSFCLS